MSNSSASRIQSADSHGLVRRVTVLAAALLLSATACREPVTAPSAAPGETTKEISSGVIGASQRQLFFLLRGYQNDEFQGAFDASLSPEITVCLWVDDACQSTVLGPVTLGKRGEATLRVNRQRQRYVFQWRTRGASLQPNAVYRLIVRDGGLQLGYLDIATGLKQRDLRGIDRREFLPLRVGGKVKVAFRIEQGPAIPSGIPGRYESDQDACVTGCLARATPWNYFSVVWGGVRLDDLGGYGEAIVGFTGTYDDPNPPIPPVPAPGTVNIPLTGSWSWRYDTEGGVEIWVDGLEWGHWAASGGDAFLVPSYPPFSVFDSPLHRITEIATDQ